MIASTPKIETTIRNSGLSWKEFVKICSFLVTQYYFWVCVACCALVEPVLCAYYPTRGILVAQIVILFLAAFLFIIQSIGEVAANWDEIIGTDDAGDVISKIIISSKPSGKRSTYVKCADFLVYKGRNIVEFVCFVTGFVFIWKRPGIAALRCFRVFRLLWFYESNIVQEGAHASLSTIVGRAAVDRTFALMQFAIRSLTALGNEMFRFTGKTKGGLILMIVFFYTAFVFGAALWVETGHKLRACRTLGSCTYTMMRLTFYDGTGFDYAYELSAQGHRFLFILVMIYLCVTSFGILNGLVGLFGTAFNEASLMAFEGSSSDQDRSVQKPINSPPTVTAEEEIASASNMNPDVDSHSEDGDPTSTLSPADLSQYRQITGKDFDVEANGSSLGAKKSLVGKGQSAYGMFGQFSLPSTQQQQHQQQQIRQRSDGDVTQSDLAAVLAVMESRFKSQHEDIVHMLLLQSRMQMEIHRLCEASGLEVDPMFTDVISGKVLPVKPRKAVHSPVVSRDVDSDVTSDTYRPVESASWTLSVENGNVV